MRSTRFNVRTMFGTAALAALVLQMTPASAYASPLRCKLDGTFFPPTIEGATADVLNSALGSCKNLGRATFTGVLTAGTTPDVNGCVTVVSSGPSIAFDRKGDSFTYTVSGTECYKDANGQIPTTAGFCGASTDTFTSTILATITVSDGTGKKAGTTGSGTLAGTVNHCDSTAPFGNSFRATMNGALAP